MTFLNALAWMRQAIAVADGALIHPGGFDEFVGGIRGIGGGDRGR